jgi:transcriptional regulator with XRE-family HTH domain
MQTTEDRLKKAFNYLKLEGLISTQEELGEKIGYDKATVSQALNGSKKHLTNSFISKFCKNFMQINEDWITEGKGEMLKSVINQNNIEGDNIQGSDFTVKKSETEIFFDLLKTKDEQINRLIGIIENFKS